MIKYKVYLCNNEKHLENFRKSESTCRTRIFCSRACCEEDTIEQEGSLDDLCDCKDCMGGQNGSWASVAHISIMCGEPEWFDFNWLRTIALVFATLFLPERVFTNPHEIKTAKLLHRMWNSGLINFRDLSGETDQEIQKKVLELKGVNLCLGNSWNEEES